MVLYYSVQCRPLSVKCVGAAVLGEKEDGGRTRSGQRRSQWGPRLGVHNGVIDGPEISRSQQHDGVHTGIILVVHREQETPQPRRALLDEVAEEM